MACKGIHISSRMDDSDKDSLSSMEAYEEEQPENPEDVEKITNVRNAVREWKVRELDKTTDETANAKGLQNLRSFVAKTGRLYYDLVNYLKTSRNKEQNMKDTLYVNIVTAMGVPGSLSFHVKTILESLLQRDLLELPYTLEPKVINTYAKNGIQAQQEFPEEE
jgi:hypothetical protein